MSVGADPDPRGTRYGAVLAGPTVAILLLAFGDLEPGRPEVTRTAAIAAWMAVWWMTEAVPLAVTALLPIVLFPVLGVMNGKVVAPFYFNHIIFLFVGGFMVALAMERWELHRRIAVRVLLLAGTNPRGILAGFMAATAFLSMWISNTATTMMMVPIVLAVILRFEEAVGADRVRRYSVGLLLAVAYSGSLGGIATLVGTPPNLVLTQIFSQTFPEAPEISFVSWMLFALPVSVISLAALWLAFSVIFTGEIGETRLDRATFREEYRKLGPMSFEEKVVLTDFVALAVLWLTRADLRIGSVTLPGWSRWLEHPSYVNDGTVAIAIALLLFVVPSRRDPGTRVLDWRTAVKLPWNIVLLFGGGLALAGGFASSGLSEWVGQRLAGLHTLHPVILILAVCLLITFLTELTSNTATAQVLLPILAALSMSIGLHPLLLMIPGTLSCSMAFMLPVATPPNAIVFGTGQLKIAEMARVGLVMNFAGALLVTVSVWWIGRAVFGIDLGTMPAWAIR